MRPRAAARNSAASVWLMCAGYDLQGARHAGATSVKNSCDALRSRRSAQPASCLRGLQGSCGPQAHSQPGAYPDAARAGMLDACREAKHTLHDTRYTAGAPVFARHHAEEGRRGVGGGHLALELGRERPVIKVAAGCGRREAQGPRA